MRITQQTAELVTIAFAPAAPSGSFSATLAHVYAVAGPSSLPNNCDDYPEVCDQSPVPTLTPIAASGALTTGVWSWTMVDETSNERMPCSTTCDLPGRAPGAAPRTYRVTVAASELWNLWPHPTQFAISELTIDGHVVPGVWLTGAPKLQRCGQLKTINSVTVCIARREYTELLALDRAALAMPSLAIQISTGIGPQVSTVPYLPNGAVATPSVNWNGGDGPL